MLNKRLNTPSAFLTTTPTTQNPPEAITTHPAATPTKTPISLQTPCHAVPLPSAHLQATKTTPAMKTPVSHPTPSTSPPQPKVSTFENQFLESTRSTSTNRLAMELVQLNPNSLSLTGNGLLLRMSINSRLIDNASLVDRQVNITSHPLP